jgi:membrane-associated phospholipid phosphatase
LRQLLHDVARLADPLTYAVAGLALLAVAAVRGRWLLAGLLPVLLVGSGATTQVLKHALAHPRVAAFLGSEQISATAWPSGHATAAMTLALAAVLVAPARHRPVVALAGAAFAAVVAYAVLVLAWHFPSDALGGFLVAAAWALGVTALLALVRRDDPPRAPTSAWQAAGVLSLLGGTALFAAVAAAALVHPAARVAVENASFLAVLVAVAALAAVLALGVSRAAEG